MKYNKSSIFTGGTFISAILSFVPLACCVFPLSFAFLGAGSLAFATSLMPYRPYFVVMTLVFLGLGFYFAYRPQKNECQNGDACAKTESRKAPRIILWAVTVITLTLLVYPYLLPYLPA
jgi:mercuric ion transport protein